MSSELQLLQQYEPVVRYTLGELYYPCSVNEYVKRSSLWRRTAKGEPMLLEDWGELTLPDLASYSEIPDGNSLYMRFVREPMDMIQYSRWRLRPDRPSFYAGGRLARVGIFARIIDSIFDLSILIRGSVPGGTTAAADIKFQKMRADNPKNVYYGRVVRVGGYTVLHYLFFYAMNDWRSSFYGINDHESDWEQIFVYLSGENDNLTPRWVAYASHDFHGDDLRRRWDDPELERIDETHPVVYAGAGSHASYYLPGEYLMNVEPPLLKPVRRVLDWVVEFWSETLGQGDRAGDQELHEATKAFVSIPFIDYARGDGVHIGPGQQEEWTPVLIDDGVPWVDRYRGLWGLDTNDPLGGERAPSGPKYNRDGSVRRSWYDPLGWSGLDKETPPEELDNELSVQVMRLMERGKRLEEEILSQREKLRSLSLEVAALNQSEFVSAIEEEQQQKLDEEEARLNALYEERMNTMETRKSTQRYQSKIRAGDFGDPHAHLHNQHRPEPPITNQSQVLEFWSAVSGGLLLLLIALVVFLQPTHWPWWLIGIGFAFFAFEAAARGYLSKYLLNISIFLAIISSVLLIVRFWWLGILGLIIALVVFMIRENLREWRFNRSIARMVGADHTVPDGDD